MKILSAPQIKEIDSATIINEPISSIDLMERAARNCLFKILNHDDVDTNFAIICGKGNNGGDGLAIARMLAERNRNVNVIILEYTQNESPEFKHNLDLLAQQSKAQLTHVNSLADFKNIDLSKSIVIDAILGIGINKAVEGLVKDVIEFLNSESYFVISIDIPSGMFPDEMNDKNVIVRANKTLTFQVPKYNFVFPENIAYTGELIIVDIDLDQQALKASATKNYLTDKKTIKELLLSRSLFSHKGNFGHALLICGSKGMMGAAQLSARACLRSGAGLLSVKVPGCGLNILQTSLPEAMVIADAENDYITSLPDTHKYNAIGIGCGIGTDKQTQNVLKLLIQNSPIPLLIDADALNILADNKTWFSFLPKYSILTPHPKEFDRLAGAHTNTYQRLATAKEFAQKYQVIIVLKGIFTACIMPDGNVFFNSTGNPGMAKGGSGDTLTGIITGLLARGYAPNHAAILGVYVHGLAADLCLKKNHIESLLASDVIEKLPKAFTKVYDYD